MQLKVKPYSQSSAFNGIIPKLSEKVYANAPTNELLK
jgi:hypothetical protein